MAELQFPNIVGMFQQGQQYGQAQRANKLAGLAYGSQGADRQAALGQLAGVDPRLALGLGDAFQQQDAAQQQQARAQEVDHAKKINGAANFMLQAVQSKDPARIQGAWSSVAPYLSEVTGRQAPPQWDDSMLPGLYQTLSATGGMKQEKPTLVTPGTVALGPDNKPIFSNPTKPANAQLVDVPDGRGGSFKMLFDPSTGQLSHPGFSQPGQGGYSTATLPPDASVAGGPAVTPASPFNTQAAAEANAMLAQHMDPTAIMQHLAAKYPTQRFDIALDPATGQFKDVSNGSARMPQGGGLGYAPPKQTPQVHTLTPDELKANGLPPGSVAQQDENGKISVVSRPSQVSPDKLADIAAKRQKAKAAQQDALSNLDDSISQIDTLLQSPGFSDIGTFMGDTIGRIPHTNTADARAQLDTIGNQSLLNTLSTMKSLSATGASGFGALSDSEGRILRNAASNLTEGQSNQAIRQHLLDYKNKLMRTRERLASMQVSLPEDSVAGGQQPAQPAQPTMQSARPRATNPQTGQTVEFDGQQWVPVHG